MNQRFQNAEINLVAKQYAENELYKGISTIGLQLESELPEFGLCLEECFMETLELLSTIADKGEDILPEVENMWLRKSNEYKRFDRHVCDNEISKAVGIVFGFAILAIDSSHHRFYRYTLTERLTQVIAYHPFEGWASTLERIFSIPLSDGWFDSFIDEEPQECDDMKEFVKGINAIRKQIPSSPLMIQLVQNQYNTSCQQFMGKMENPNFIAPKQDETVKYKHGRDEDVRRL